MGVHLKTSKDINATPGQVWEILTDLDSFASWNPLFPTAAGRLAVGEKLKLRLQPLTGKAMTIHPRIRQVDSGRELRWMGRAGIPGIFDGEHRFTLEPTPGGCRLTHEERFSGMLVPLAARGLRTRYLPAFEAMNEALAERAETGATQVQRAI
jgi:hypothetical protein